MFSEIWTRLFWQASMVRRNDACISFSFFPPLKDLQHELTVDLTLDTIPDRVEDHLFIGSFAASRNYAALHMLGITHVINAAGMQDSDKKMPLVRSHIHGPRSINSLLISVSM
jgi:hypothetical protein